MSRPANPSYAVPVWAPDLNYPAGGNPWSATPTKSTHPGAASVGYTPDQGVPAQCFNKNLNDAYTADDAAKTKISELYTYLGQLQATNWPNQSSPGASQHFCVFYVPPTRKWYMTGDIEDVKASNTGHIGSTWDSASQVAAAGAGEHCRYGDYDASGNVIVTTTDRYIFELTASTGTWTKVDVTGFAQNGAPFNSGIAFDPVRSLWCWVSNDSVGGFIIMTSANRTAWTQRTNPTGFVNTDKFAVAVNKSTGRLVAMQWDPAVPAVRVATCDDGGITWTARANLTSTIGSPERITLQYDVDAGYWYMTIGEVTGTPTSEVWRSTDQGVTWSKMCTLANYHVAHVAGFNNLLVSVARGTGVNEIVYSLDFGATWQFAGVRMNGTFVQGCFKGGGKPVAVTSQWIFAGVTCGVPGVGSLT